MWFVAMLNRTWSPALSSLSGKLKEWTLILHGTAEHPYHSQGSQHSRSRMLETPTAGKELKNTDAVPGAPEHEEEEEEEYNGTRSNI